MQTVRRSGLLAVALGSPAPEFCVKSLTDACGSATSSDSWLSCATAGRWPAVGFVAGNRGQLGPGSDTITALAGDARVREDACGAVANDLVSRKPRAQEYEGAYRRLQKAARRVLRDYPPIGERSPDQDQDAERATTWWCARCGGIDAPQPCLGICVWRHIDWVNANLYEQQRERALARHETELRLRLLLQRVASITPREGHWQHGWAVIQAEGRAALVPCVNRAKAH